MARVTLDTRYRLLKLLQKDPSVSQRRLATELGISLGKTNYCLKALMEKGFVKASNFKQNPHKRAYGYLLTPAGMQEKVRVTQRFLRRKREEYEALEREIAELRKEVSDMPATEDIQSEGRT